MKLGATIDHTTLITTLQAIERDAFVPLLAAHVSVYDVKGLVAISDFFTHMLEKSLIPVITYGALTNRMSETDALLKVHEAVNEIRDGLVKALQESIVDLFKLQAEADRNPEKIMRMAEDARAHLQRVMKQTTEKSHDDKPH